jgi:2-oxo-4-hydroxy-4-carboxy--5-ureidoimidazoline (OHCU) decarboxylase
VKMIKNMRRRYSANLGFCVIVLVRIRTKEGRYSAFRRKLSMKLERGRYSACGTNLTTKF